MGSATAQTILIKSGNAWRGFFRLLELKSEGRLPPYITRINPPGCNKRKRNSGALWTVLRKDQYEMDGDEIIFKWLGAIGWIEVRCNGDGCGVRISRGLFRCTRLNKVFNADLAAAHNILMTSITPSPERGGGNGPETRPGAKPAGIQECSPNLPTLSREEVISLLPSSFFSSHNDTVMRGGKASSKHSCACSKKKKRKVGVWV